MEDGKKEILWRVYLVYFFMLLFSLVIISRLFYIQYKQGDELRAMAKTQELRIADLPATRGNILASNGYLLAASVPVFELRLDLGVETITDDIFNNNVDSLAAGLSFILGKPGKAEFKTGLINARQARNRYYFLAKKVTYDQLKQIRKLPILRMGRYKGGLIAEQSTMRILPYGNLAARTIGYEILEENLFVGLEGAYSSSLTGKDGKQLQRRINNGDWIPIHDENEVEPRNGFDILTTIDINIQDVTENALLRQLQKNEANMGCAVVMEVETGYIRAIANLKRNEKTGVYEESLNYAIGSGIEPGSTFKLPNIIVAIERGKIKLTDIVVTGNGTAAMNGMTVRDVHQIGNGVVTVRDVFEQSSNVGMARIINNCFQYSPETFIEGLYSMNLNKPLEVEIPGEGKPFLKHPDNKALWWRTSLTAMSFGYEMQITPLQLLTFYNAVANNGKMMKPVFVLEIRDGAIVKQKNDTVVINPAIASPATIATAKSLLEGVVTDGTAKSVFKKAPYSAAGKTGTAKLVEDGIYTKRYNASFVGYFPADKPKYSCIVVINKPNAGLIYGGAVAAPAFKEIADKIYATSLGIDEFQVPDTVKVTYPVFAYPAPFSEINTIYADLNIPAIEKAHDQEWAKSEAREFGIVVDSISIPDVSVPDVRGMKAREAIYLLEQAGLKPSVAGKGQVISQSSKPGSQIMEGDMIYLQLSMYYKPTDEDSTGNIIQDGGN